MGVQPVAVMKNVMTAFSLSGRVGRADYWRRVCVALVAFLALRAVAGSVSIEEVKIFVSLLALMVFLYIGCQTVRRVRDTGYPIAFGFAIIATLVSYVAAIGLAFLLSRLVEIEMGPGEGIMFSLLFYLLAIVFGALNLVSLGLSALPTNAQLRSDPEVAT